MNEDDEERKGEPMVMEMPQTSRSDDIYGPTIDEFRQRPNLSVYIWYCIKRALDDF